jgi:HK97 family phage portal protein
VNWRERVAELIGGRKFENASLPAIVRSSEWVDFFEVADGMPQLTERAALQISSVYACVGLIAGTIQAMPVNIYAYSPDDGERSRLYGDTLHWVLNEEFSPRWSAANGWEFLCRSMLLHGNAYAVIMRDSNSQPVGLRPIHPDRVVVATTTDESRLVYGVHPEMMTERSDQGVLKVYDQDDILHVPGFGFDGLKGMSPLNYALRMAGGSSKAMQEFMMNFYLNSARPDYVLQTDQLVGADFVADLRRQIDENHRGAGKAHRPMVLQGGLDIKPMTMPLKDMEIVAARQFQTEEIARIYGVPPFMIGSMDKTTAWGTGIDSMGIGFVRYTLRKHLNKFENEMNRKLFRTASRVLEFDTSDLERADNKSFMESLRTAVGRAGEPKIMSVNEARKSLRMKRDENPESDSLEPVESQAQSQPKEAPANGQPTS